MTSVVRRVLGGTWLVVALVVSACALQPEEQVPVRAEEGSPKSVVTEITTTVADLDASTRFFSEVLGASVEDTKELSGAELDSLLGTEGARVRVRTLRLGRERLQLMQFLEAKGAPPRADARSNDQDFQHIALVVSDIDQMHERVVQAGVTAVTIGGPQRIPDSNVAAAGVRAFYFRDRDRRPLELISYPPDKGLPRWHERGGALMLGVDHTAIAITSTRRSREFYEGLLGLSLRGESLNEGTEQAALSGVPGARVRITGLGGPSGPGIEFLEYEAPGPGRQLPPREPADVGYWEVTVYVPEFDEVLEAVRRARTRFVSRRVATCETCERGRRAVVVYGPDGHAVRLAGD